MPFDPSTDLDPALMEPSDKFLRNLPPNTTANPRINTATTGSGSEDEEDLPPGPTSDILIPPAAIHTVTSAEKMQATGRIIAKRMRLTTESEADLDRFCTVSNYQN
jgi:hypothetical protein